jgi:hypothetical protein
MRVRRVLVALTASGLLSAAATGCTDQGNRSVDSSDATVATSVSSAATGSRHGAIPVPDRVTVNRPGFIDTALSPNDVPTWPGPDPREFLRPSPPTGESGELRGRQAEQVFVAAQSNSNMLWNVAGDVQRLVVVPLL